MERVDPDKDSIKIGSGFHMKNSIREAAPGDCGAVYGLITALEGKPVDREAFSDIYRANLRNPSVHYFVWDRDGAVAGFVSLHVQKH